MIKSSIHFFNILVIAIIALIIDYIIYITNFSYSTIVIPISTIVIGIYILLLKKGILKLTKNFEILDLIFCIGIIAFAISKISIPDFSYDVRNYHIYLQENIKTDKINFDFFTGNIINGFLFPLGDRIYYISRFFLGYRLGTILSYYSIIVIFYQTKNILKLFFENHQLLSLCSTICYSSFILRQWTGTYYIDSLSVIFLLEIIYYVLKETILKNRKLLFFITLLSGIATAIKITNLILIIPIAVFVLIKERKYIDKKIILNFIISIIIFCLPFLIYVIDNLKQTGNPIFPYYNNIFKSNFFGEFSWKDSRFGIPSLKHAIIWPIYVSSIIQGYGDDWQIYDYIWAIGYLISIFMFVYFIIYKDIKNKKIFSLVLISLILTIIWIVFLEGYMRYALIIPVLYSILIGYIILNITKKINFEFTNKLRIILTITAIIIITTITIKNLDEEKIDNYSMILKDKNQTISIDGVWGVYGNNSALTELVRESNVPIYNLDIENINSSEKNIEKYKEIIKNKKIYILCNNELYLDILKSQGFNIEFFKEYTSKELPYISKNDSIKIYKLTNNNNF